jgi:hypothetical protein
MLGRRKQLVLPDFVRGEAITVFERLDAWTDTLALVKAGHIAGLPEFEASEMAAQDAAYSSAGDTFWAIAKAWEQRACADSPNMATAAILHCAQVAGVSVMSDWACYQIWLRYPENSEEVGLAADETQQGKRVFDFQTDVARRLLIGGMPGQELERHYAMMATRYKDAFERYERMRDLAGAAR